MKILQLVNRIPYPLNDGGNLAVYFYTEGFVKAGVSLSMLAMNTSRHWVSEEKLPEIFSKLVGFQSVKVDNRIKVLPAFFNLFTNKSYNVSRFINKGYANALTALLKKDDFDIIQLEGLYLVPYISIIRKFSHAKIVLRQHNVEFVIWKRLAEQEKSLLKKSYLQLLCRRLKSFEIQTLNQPDLLLPISETDATSFRQLGAKQPIFVQSFGVDISKIPFSPASQPPISLYHLGAMDWQPNREAVFFFLKEVWPKVTKALPELVFHLAGRNMPESLFQLQNKNIIVHGEVADAALFEKDKSILVVPLLSGGGVRIKIFRAMAMGKAIISTKIGMEGIPVSNGKEAFIADNAQEMADKIIKLAQNPNQVKEMGNAARSFIERNYDQQKMIAALLEKYRELINQ